MIDGIVDIANATDYFDMVCIAEKTGGACVTPAHKETADYIEGRYG